MASQSGILPDTECIEAFNRLKLGRTGVKFIIYKIENQQKIVVTEESKDPDFAAFEKAMVGEDEATKPKYAVYDVEYELPGGEGKRSKLCLIRYIPDDSAVKERMVYGASFNGLKNALAGVPKEWQCSDKDEITWDQLLEKVK